MTFCLLMTISCQLTELFLELTLYVVTLSRTIREARYVRQRPLIVVIIVYCVLFTVLFTFLIKKHPVHIELNNSITIIETNTGDTVSKA